MPKTDIALPNKPKITVDVNGGETKIYMEGITIVFHDNDAKVPAPKPIEPEHRPKVTSVPVLVKDEVIGVAGAVLPMSSWRCKKLRQDNSEKPTEQNPIVNIDGEAFLPCNMRAEKGLIRQCHGAGKYLVRTVSPAGRVMVRVACHAHAAKLAKKNGFEMPF